ncbi:peptide chain release factor 1 [Actinospongicola halichondriae]|uniref:peptide chain release factor 1 n=1 Tax=Actinospongicola halichondriae TaxID=3236844 RepID=UPI003D428908
MLDRLDALEHEFLDLQARLGDPELIADQQRYADAARRYHELEGIVEVGRELRARTGDLETAREFARESEGDDKELFRAEAVETEADVERLSEKLKYLLLPKDPNEGRNVIVEIRGAEGGEEANLFARDLFQMYEAFAARMGWKLEVLNTDHSDMGGYNDITFVVKGDGAWTRMKHEGGPHRVQRVPVTEAQGRIHTSSATVTVLPEVDDVEIDIDEKNDLEIQVYRSSGPGGQSVNTTDSAVRITHKPTGVVVAMQDEKSQLQNKAKALRVLKSRLFQLEQERQQAELSSARKDQVGGGGRSEKIRTYNFKENRVTHHDIGLTVYKLDKVLAGELDDISDALVQDEQTKRLEGDED